jgi:hypothetical protein
MAMARIQNMERMMPGLYLRILETARMMIPKAPKMGDNRLVWISLAKTSKRMAPEK